MKIVDALVLKSLSGVGDGSVAKILQIAVEKRVATLEELAEIELGFLSKRVQSRLEGFLSQGQFADERARVSGELNNWRGMGISVVHLSSQEYPKHIQDLEDPPPFLFCKGDLSLLKRTRAIAVVGTRKNSPKGAQIAKKTVEAFHRHDFIVVSGLALGIDTVAHSAALDCGARTVAVLVDVSNIAPPANRKLAQKILQNDGLLVAENIPGTPTVGALFAKRDRIQSGLSAAVFAIETSRNGGTMHAVRAAEKMNRPIFVPDVAAARYLDVSLEAIQGTQQLLDEGRARSYTSELYDRISDELGEVSGQLTKKYLSETKDGHY